MPRFKFSGRDKSGKPVSGIIEAIDINNAISLLKHRSIQVTQSSVKEIKGFSWSPFSAKVRLKDLVIFTRQLATLIQAGLPVTQSLDLLKQQTESKALAKALVQIQQNIESGEPMSEAFAKHENIFDSLYCNLIAAGEQGGFLDQVLARLATYLEKYSKLKRELTVALIYPALLILTAVIVIAVIMLFVIPTFKEIFADFGASLPLPTRIVIEISNLTVRYWYIIFGAIAGLGYAGWRFYRSDRGKELIEPTLVKIPVLGQIIVKGGIARFSRTLATMLASGVPVIQALETCSKVAGNVLIERAINDTIKSVTEGRPISETLKAHSIFPPMVYGMVSVGEQTGALETMLEKLATFYEEEVEASVQSMKQLIEPVLILVIGTIIGALVISMYLPIFKLGTVIG